MIGDTSKAIDYRTGIKLSQPEIGPKIPVALDELGKEINILSEMIGNLEDRLKLALHDAVPKAEKAFDTANMVPLEITIREQANKVHSMKEWIGSILGRLEL